MATIKQKKTAELLLENPGMSTGAAMKQAGYAPASVKNPQELTTTKTWQDLMDEYLPDGKLAEAHKKLLGAKRIDHLVFPLSMTDEEITELIESVGGKVRKFKHGDTAVHCWFWVEDSGTQTKGLELAYKIKGHLAGDTPPPPLPAGNTMNVFIGAEAAREFAEWFEEKTKRELAG